jgi:GTP-binding protein Era
MTVADRIQSGYVLIAGPGNTGKSSLLNRLAGYPLSPVHPEPGTTRFPITGVYTSPEAQACFVDSPPLETSGSEDWARACDAAVLLLDARRPVEQLRSVSVADFLNTAALQGKPVVAALGHGDHLPRRLRVPIALQAGLGMRCAGVVTVCPPLGAGVDALRKMVLNLLPVRERLFPDAVNTLNSSRFLASELVRSVLLCGLTREVADSVAVQVEEYSRTDRKLYIRVNLLVARAGDKGTVIGRKGQTLARIQKDAETALQEAWGGPVQMEIWVKVREGWTERPADLLELGYAR